MAKKYAIFYHNYRALPQNFLRVNPKLEATKAQFMKKTLQKILSKRFLTVIITYLCYLDHLISLKFSKIR